MAKQSITIRLSPSDAEIIESNLKSLSLQLGYQLNVSNFLRHVLKTNTSKHSLYLMGFISYQELHNDVKVNKGQREIKLNRRRFMK